MLSVSERYLQSVVADSRDMPYRVTIAGVGLLDKSKVSNMTLDESVSGTSGIELGTANSATLQLTIKDAQPIDYSDLMVLPESGLVLPDGSIEWVSLGVFWVTDSSTSNDYKTLNLTCSDGMYNMSGEYVSRLTYPSTIKAVVAEIVAQAGVEFEGIDSLPDIPVRRRLEGATHRVAIGYAAGCCGKNARFNRQGKLEFTWYNDTGITIERRTQYLDGMTRLNNARLEVGFEVTGQKETYSVEVISDGNGGVIATPGHGVLENDRVVLSISPFEGYEMATLVAVTEQGTNVTLYMNSSGGYDFIQPDSNVIVTASFRRNAEGPFELTTRAFDGGTITQEASGHESGDNYFNEGDTATVTITPDEGKQIDRIVTTPGDLEYTQNGSLYSFAMPQSDVTVTVYFKDAEAIVTPYSWLQSPVAPPVLKPYWAVFYKDDPNLPTCQKYYLIWFDSWSATVYDTAYDLNEYKITLNGYYYCGGKNSGDGAHEWDSSAWTGNGDAGSYIEWNSYCGFMWSGTDSERIDEQYCLIASNADLLHNGSAIFDHNENDITGVQTSYIQDGMDVRERGSLSYWMCPDTFSTPLPSPNWMILMPESGLYMTVGEDGKYTAPASSYPDSMIVLFYDNINIQSIGSVGSQSGEEFYIASVTNGRWAYMRSENLGWDELHELPEGAVIGLRNPLISTEPDYIYSDGNDYQFAGILATNTTLSAGGNVFMFNNACRVCDCVSSGRVAMFSRRSAASNLIHEDSIELDARAEADGDAIILHGVIARSYGDSLELIPMNPIEHVKISYTNPMIYEKMVPYIESVVQGITYTPAKVKHRGNPAFQAGDIVNVPDKTGWVHAVLIMQQRMVFGGGMNSEITCPGQSEKTKSFSASSSSNSKVNQDIERANSDLEHRIAVNNALVYAAIYKTISSSEASIRLLTEWQTENSNALTEFEQTVRENYATQGMMSQVATDASNALAEYRQEVTDTYATQGMMSQVATDASNALAEYRQEVTDTYATQGMLTKYQTETSNALTAITQTADKDRSAIELLVEYDSEGNPKTSAGLLIEAINGESTAKIKVDRLDIEGKITADHLSVTELASLNATIGGFDISTSGLSKTVTTLDSSSGTNILLTEKVNITPDLIRVEEDKSVGSPLMYYNKKVEISNGSIHVTRSGIDTVLGANPSFMDVTIKGTTYKLYIDPGTLTVKVEAI